MLKNVKIKSYEKGIVYIDNSPVELLQSGNNFVAHPFKNAKVYSYDERNPWLESDKIDLIVKSGIANDFLTVVDLKDNQRALVWVEGRFNRILSPGLYALWNRVKDVKVEVITLDSALFEHENIEAILLNRQAPLFLDVYSILEGCEGLFFFNGKMVSRLEPGRYAFWKNCGNVKIYNKDMREKVVEISGQDIMTNDNVTLRVNAALSYRIVDSYKAVMFSEDIDLSLYRSAQLILRSVISTRELDSFLSGKENVEVDFLSSLTKVTLSMGIEVVSFGVRDIILPGEMKELMNKVTEAKKQAEANLITRREEVAAMRSQMNTAKMLENSSSLMRLKELEVLEKIASTSQLQVILGNEKLSNKVVNLI